MTGWIRTLLTLCIGAMVLASISCTPPDRWQVFEDQLNERIEAERKREPVDDKANAHQPRMTDTPATFELPDNGESAPLSVEQAVMLALRNNRDLQVQQLNPVITGTFEQIERGVFDPEVFAEAQWRKELASETARSTGEQFSVEGRDTEVIAGVRQQLPTGAEIEATVEQVRSASDRAPEQQTARLGLTMTQQLLEGFGPAVNLASIRQAELDTKASVHELRGFAEALLADVEIAYWNFVLAGQEIEIFEQSLQIARQQRDEVEQRIEVGVLPQTEAAAARTEVALREQALIDARSALREARLRLLRLINPGPNDQLDVELDATSDPTVETEPIDNLADRLRLAVQSRPDLNEARLRLEQNRLETIVTRNGLLPQLELFITLGKTGFEDTLARSFHELEEDTYDVTAGVRFSQLLGNRAAEARDLAARTSRHQSARAVANLQQLVRFDVRLAANEVERARQQIDATAATRSLQEQTLAAEKERFNVGSSTALLVAQAQRDLLASRIAEVEAIVNYRIALVELYLAEGTLLDRRGIQLAGK